MIDDHQKRRRFFVEAVTEPSVKLPAGEARHASRVLRLKAGAAVELFDGRGGVAEGHLESIARDEAIVRVDSIRRAAGRDEPVVHLAFAVPKARRLDWLLEKACELGAASLRPVVFERSVSGGDKLSPAGRDRRRARCIAAAKQCGLDFLPDIHDSAALVDFIPTVSDCLAIVGSGDATAQVLPAAIAQWRPGREICILVGPEGGLTETELDAATDAGFVPVRLGRATLRVETAVIALLAAATALCGQ